MGVQPARRADRPAPRRSQRASVSPRTERAAKLELRRRERHFRRRRRDLLEDAGFALVVTITLLTVTAGLGILALIEVPIAAALVTSVLAERAIKRRRGRDRRGARRSSRAPARRT